MPKSYAEVVTSGSTSNFAVPFPYLDKGHVHVRVNGVKLDGDPFTWPSGSTLTLNTPVPAGTTVRTYRETPTPNLAQFQSGNISTLALNTAARQALYVAEETQDFALEIQSVLQAQIGGILDAAQTDLQAIYDQAQDDLEAAFDLTVAALQLRQAIIDGITTGPISVPAPIAGYVQKSNGANSSTTSGWFRTDYVAVTKSTTIQRTGSFIQESSAAAEFAFYDENLAYLGHYNSGSSSSMITVGDFFENAAFVRGSCASAVIGTFTFIVNPQVDLRAVPGLDLLYSAFYRDFFQEDDIVTGYVTSTGGFSGSDTWRSTPFIPTVPGAKFRYSGQATSLVSAISMWDEDKLFLGRIVPPASTVNNFEVTITNAACRYVRASSTANANNMFQGPKVPEAPSSAGGGTAEFSTVSMVPQEAFGKVGETLYMYPRGICPDRSLSVMLDQSRSNEQVCLLTSDATGDQNVRVKVRRGGDTLELGTFPVHWGRSDPVSPSAMRNVIVIGESTVELGEGRWTNELSRRLTGTGDAALADPLLTPAALSLTNIQFLGTRGSGTVKHEGRSGWRLRGYLTAAELGGVSNAFWNPSTSQFDLAYYLEQNSFRAEDITGGVNSTGSNLTIFLGEGWNASYSGTAEAAANDLVLFIGRVRATHPNTDIIVMGLNPPPFLNSKAFTAGDRFISQEEVFANHVRAMGVQYRAACNANGADFVQISHVFDMENGYSINSQRRSARVSSSVTVGGGNDHVHPAEAGMAMIADAAFYKFLHKYCQGT